MSSSCAGLAEGLKKLHVISSWITKFLDVRVARQSVPKRVASHVIMIISGHGVQDDLDNAMYNAFTFTDPRAPNRDTFSQKLAKYVIR